MQFKQIKMPDELIKAIQEYADSHTDGNFSMAVRQLIKSGLIRFNKV
jgi:hypothetical protein